MSWNSGPCRNSATAETYVDNVVRKQEFADDHPDWKIWCENYRWYANPGDQEFSDDDLGLLMDRIERIADMDRAGNEMGLLQQRIRHTRRDRRGRQRPSA